MHNFGLGFGYFFVQFFSLAALFAWIILVILGLLKLKKQVLPPTAKAVWALVIVAVPLLGALAYLIIKPTQE